MVREINGFQLVTENFVTFEKKWYECSVKRISWYFVESFINIADLGGNCEGSYTSYSSLKQVKFKKREREERKNKQTAQPHNKMPAAHRNPKLHFPR